MLRRDATKNDQGYGPGKLLMFFTLLRGSANASTAVEGTVLLHELVMRSCASFVGSATVGLADPTVSAPLLLLATLLGRGGTGEGEREEAEASGGTEGGRAGGSAGRGRAEKGRRRRGTRGTRASRSYPPPET